MEHIIPGGSHERIQPDLWEFDKELSEKINFKYILEIKDCFSKWLWCVPLQDKNGETVLREIKKYIISFGKPSIIQTDNVANSIIYNQNYITKIMILNI